MADDLDEDDRERLKASIDDVIADTPGTNRAILTLKKLLPRVGRDTYDAMRATLIAVATEAAKKSLGY